MKPAPLKRESFSWLAQSWTNWKRISFRHARKAWARIRRDGQIMNFHVLSGYWTISVRGTMSNPAASN